MTCLSPDVTGQEVCTKRLELGDVVAQQSLYLQSATPPHMVTPHTC